MQGKPARIYTAQHFSPLHQPNTSRPTMTLLVTRPPETNLISEFPARSGEHARIAGRTPTYQPSAPRCPTKPGKGLHACSDPAPWEVSPGACDSSLSLRANIPLVSSRRPTPNEVPAPQGGDSRGKFWNVFVVTTCDLCDAPPPSLLV